MVTGQRSAKTMWAASGSTAMLNSAAGVRLPPAYAPPITTTSRTRSTIRGSSRTASARFVRAAVATRVISPAGRLNTVSMISATACRESNGIVGPGRVTPSRPDVPCSASATRGARTSGRTAPAAIGRSRRPPTVSTAKALRVTLSSVWFPATVVTASRSTSGRP